jgi:hypothetical protein
MRTSIVLDYEQVRQAQELTGITEDISSLVFEALKTLIEVEASRRLALLGGTMPELEDVPRRRSSVE